MRLRARQRGQCSIASQLAFDVIASAQRGQVSSIMVGSRTGDRGSPLGSRLPDNGGGARCVLVRDGEPAGDPTAAGVPLR